MRRSFITAAAALAVASLLLVGCTSERDGGAAPSGLASHSSTPSGPPTTKILSDVGFKVTPSGSGAYEIHIRVYGEPDFDKKTGEVSVSTLDKAGSAYGGQEGVGKLSIDPTSCGFRHGTDLIVPFEVSVRALSKIHLFGNVLADLDDVYGFQPSGSGPFDYINRFGVITSNECNFVTPSSNKFVQSRLPVSDIEKSTGEVSSISFLMIENGAKLTQANKELLLSAFAIHPGILGLVPDGQKVAVKYLNPDQTRLLKTNGCLALYVPLDVSVPNAEWTSLNDQKCDSTVFTTAQNGF